MRLATASYIELTSSIIRLCARVVKLVYTAGLKPAAAKPGMPVRFRSLAPPDADSREAWIFDLAAARPKRALVSDF
jgi:hypothetical protein